MNASGCGVTVKEYGHTLAHDPAYATKAGRIADLTRDIAELLPDLVPMLARVRPSRSATGRWEGAQPVGEAGGARGHASIPSSVHAAARAALARWRRDRARRARLRRAHRGGRGAPVLRPRRHSVLQPDTPTRSATASSRTSRLAPATIVSANIRLHPASASGRRRRCGTGSKFSTTRSARRRALGSSIPIRRWRRRSTASGASRARTAGVEKAIPPDGRCELIAHGGRPYDERAAPDACLARPASAPLCRPADGPACLCSPGRVAVLGIRLLKPAGAWTVHAGAPIAWSTDLRLDLAALHGDRRPRRRHPHCATASEAGVS